eukprot:scaffold13324_cov206-Alexandrium_tamarense.AAC.8
MVNEYNNDERHSEDDGDDQSISSDEEEFDSDGDDNGGDYDPNQEYDGKDRHNSAHGNESRGSEIKQHILAICIAIFAAVATHARVHGGWYSWKEELQKDWNTLKSSFVRESTIGSVGNVPREVKNTAPYAAPSMDAIPTAQRKMVLERALGGGAAASAVVYAGNHNPAGHGKARSYRRTRGLKFCPTQHVALSNTKSQHDLFNLVDMEFILPLEPSVRILHSYYLGDALGVDSSMVHEDVKLNNGKLLRELGSYDSDAILREIDALYASNNNNEGLALEQIISILQSYLPQSLINPHHSCLLHQYTQNKASGRSIRGVTKVYDQPHVSTFYRGKFNSGNPIATVEPNYKVPPASLTFTGFAAKFINLSGSTLNLYWDGGRIPSGPKEGEMHAVLVGTIPSMESIGTSSFPGHAFFVTPTYDKEHVLQRWTVTEDEPLLYFHPLEDMSKEEQQNEVESLVGSGKWTMKQKFAREAWMVDRSFARDYLVKTGRVWMAIFPQPYLQGVNRDRVVIDVQDSNALATMEGAVLEENQEMHMWSADYIGQIHTVETSHLYFTALPESLEKLTKEDYQVAAEEQRRLAMRQFQSTTVKANKKTEVVSGIDNNDTMPMSLKVLSCAPRVLEVKKFLSPVEVQHLIDLASGAKGDVAMQRSTVLASNVKGSDKIKIRGATKTDTRSSSGGWIHREQDVIVDTIFRRIADLLKIDKNLMRDQRPPHLIGAHGEEEGPLPTHDRVVEAMQLLRYEPGEEYNPHHDFTYPSIDNRYQPKRYVTILLYLTGEGDVIQDGIRLSPKNTNTDVDGLQGGETTFPRAITTEYHDGIKVAPQSGKAVVFYNILPDGNMDDLSQHSGGKVEKGVKYLANVWFWDPIIN